MIFVKKKKVIKLQIKKMPDTKRAPINIVENY